MSKLALSQVLETVGAMPQGKSLPSIKGKKVQSKTYYITGLAAGLGNGELILAANVPSPGVTNLPKGNTFPAGHHVVVTGVRMLFDTTAAVVAKTAAYESKAPANFYNGEIVFSQNGEGVLFESSISDIHNKKASTGNDDDFRNITPFMLRPESAYSIAINLAGAAAADQAYKLELRVEEFVDADK